ncbi:MAG: prepilin-type N-terminal cleavage/methylation domain-containing protein [Candidatus Pacebacteria bacterium]|nr:prepilin-type N-terminal cleavage/methylation domain-containing protein [Candidatus Paceibacterota bacterium]
MNIFNKLYKTKHKIKTDTKGFTLIELIVVIAIIGLLSSIVITALGVSRTRGEIARILGDYRSVSNALELYRQSHSGQYPGTPEAATNISTLINSDGPLSGYIKQSPSESPSVIGGIGHVYYYLNSTGVSSLRLWCGDTNSNQDYVIYFTPTTQASDSGLFQTLYSDVDTPVGSSVCISVNQK